MVELMTAPLWSLKKAVVSEPPPPKLILTGDLDLAVINFSSNYNSYISVMAPGNWIVGCTEKLPDSYEVYNSWNGTSQSTPMVAGLASLMFAVNPNLTPDQIKQIIEETAVDEVGRPNEDVKGFDKYHGHGRINCEAALIKVQESVGIYDNAESIVDFKQSNKPKRREWIEDYKLQLAAYALAHNEVYGTKIDKGVNTILGTAIEVLKGLVKINNQGIL